jgi:Ca2+-transporting ATPase
MELETTGAVSGVVPGLGSGAGVDPAWHSISAVAAAEVLGVEPAEGLSCAEAAERLVRFGKNELQEAAGESWVWRFLRQFQDVVIGILVLAAVLAGVMGEWLDTAAILAIVVMNGVIGFFQEERAERALSALRRMSSPSARVLRGGEQVVIPASQLVPGDLISMEAGDHIPADGRLLSAYALRVQEAALTGESMAVEKSAEVESAVDAALGDRASMVYLGTVAAAGRGTAVVTATGMRTELGRIAGLLQRAAPEPTPLQKQLASLGRSLVLVCLGIVAVILGVRLLRGGEVLETILLSVSLAVAAVPEGLPAVVTLTLALGLQRMVRRKALVRKLPSVETLGSVTVICTDKTGTLTRNEMTVREFVTASDRYVVTGAGYEPRGEFLRDSAGLSVVAGRADEELFRILFAGVRCNNAAVVPRGDIEPRWEVSGDPTEGALLVAGMKAGLGAGRNGGRVLLELPFDSARRAMSVVVEEASGERLMYTKGAPEAILERCRYEFCGGVVRELTAARRLEVLSASGALAARALRVLGLAYRTLPGADSGIAVEEDLVLLGLAGLMDPPREEARSAVARCQSAGIRVVMITGDHPETASAIGGELGISVPGGAVLTGRDLDGLTDSELLERAGNFRVFARVTAEHKLRIVSALRAAGEVVAMTGDGVNDAPAIRAADIGIAMGVTGTDVTREASDMVLMDDNFASIVNAVEEGRGIFENIRRFVHFLLTGNTGEMVLMLWAAVAGWPAPLAAIQILWINLVTDGLPALALGVEPPEANLMRCGPRRVGEGMIDLRQGCGILFRGLVLGAVAAVGFRIVLEHSPQSLGRAQGTAFGIMAFSQLLLAAGFRSFLTTIPRLGLLTNPWMLGAILISALMQLCVMLTPGMRLVFEMESALGWEWGLVFGLSLVPVTVVELGKVWRMRGGE